MKIYADIEQGSAEWLALRTQFNTASEAPAAMDASKYQSRTELLSQKFTGIAKEVSAATQRIFDKGHAAEATARSIAERIIGEELYPVTGSEGKFLASFDGLTMLEDTAWEHKLWNDDLAERVRNNDLEDHYKWQMDQQMMVSGAGRVLFMVSDGTEENCVWCWYERDEARIAQLIAGWAQFDKDLETFVEAAPVQKLEGASIDSLPALSFKLTGMVESSNIDMFKQFAIDAIKGINRTLTTDQHFADAEKAVKWCGDVETRVKEAKQAALEQTADINSLLKAMDEIGENARQTRLELEKLVKAQKAARIKAITDTAQASFDQHIAEINKGLGGRIVLPQIACDIAGALKGKRSLESMKNAADSEVARAKVEATTVGEKYLANITTLREKAGEKHGRLFADAQALVKLDNDALVALIDARIKEADAAEAKRIADAEAAAEQRGRDEKAERNRQAEEKKKAAPAATPAPAGKAAATSAPAEEAPLIGDFFGSAPVAKQPAAQKITISQAEYDQLKQDSLMLEALRAAGVDNWDGYSEAVAMLEADAEA